MSHIMEKTLASIPKLLTQSFGGGKTQTPGRPSPLSQEVMNFMKTVHRARSRSQESAIIRAELAAVKGKFQLVDAPSMSSAALRNVFTKVIFCHLLGYDVSFLGVEGMKLCSQQDGYNKRLGYLMTSLLVTRHSDIALLMMCTLQRDLQSSNMMDKWMALTVAGQLVAEDHVEYILDAVLNNLRHSHDIVKEKAINCLLEFHRISPALLQPVLPQLTPLLSSRDPGVLNALANFYLCLSKENPSDFTRLGSSFLHILHQIVNRGFGSNFYYHMVPLPWLQIKLLKILGHLGAAEASLRPSLSPVLEALIERTKVSEPISLAILMESVKTATLIQADARLLDLCSACVGKLVSTNAENNMRYQGLDLLIAMSKLNPGFAARHQAAVVACLNDSDFAIQAKTTHLLHAMANTANVKAICDKLFEHSASSNPKRSQTILTMISDLAERLVLDLSLYLHLYFKVFHSPDVTSKMRAEFVELVLSRVDRFTLTSEAGQDASIAQLATGMLDLLQNEQTAIPNLLLSLQVLGNLAPKLKAQPILEKRFLHTVRQLLTSPDDILHRQSSSHLENPQGGKLQSGLSSSDVEELKCMCLTSTTKMVLGGCLSAEAVTTWLGTLDDSQLVKNLKIRCCYEEFQHLLHHPEDIGLRGEVMFQPDSAALDLSLSFLDALIVQDLLQGKEGYVPRHQVLTERNARPASSLDASMLSSDPSDSTAVSVNRSLTSGLPTGSLVQGKWRDFDDDNDEEEQFTLVDVEERDGSLESELFAGLDNLHLQKSEGLALWEDEKHDNLSMSINIGFNLHPFGLPSKSKSLHRETKWFDEDENDNPRPHEEQIAGREFSNLPEKCVSPSNFNSNSIYSGVNDSFSKSSVHTVSSAASSGLGPKQSVNEMSMSSTVDTLTDSDPDSDENSRTVTNH